MKLKVTEDVKPITELRVKSAAVIAQVRRTRRPLVITQRGRSAIILEDVEEYESRLERLELLEAIVRGLAAAEAGDLISHEEAMKRLREAAGA